MKCPYCPNVEHCACNASDKNGRWHACHIHDPGLDSDEYGPDDSAYIDEMRGLLNLHLSCRAAFNAPPRLLQMVQALTGGNGMIPEVAGDCPNVQKLLKLHLDVLVGDSVDCCVYDNWRGEIIDTM